MARRTARWLPWSAVVPSRLPATLIKRALAEVQEELSALGVTNVLRMYPPYRVASLDRRLELCLKQPLFIECHPDPDAALSDGSTQQPLSAMPELLQRVRAIRDAVTTTAASPPANG